MPKQPPIYRPPHYTPPQQRQVEYYTNRKTTAERGYGYRWQKRRKAYLIANPVCVKCGQPSNEVDHIIPYHAVGGMIRITIRLYASPVIVERPRGRTDD